MDKAGHLQEMGRGSYEPHFVNGMMRAVWPMMNDFSRRVVNDTMEPAVKHALGSLGDNFSIDHSRYKLGEKACEFGTMTVSEAIQETGDPAQPTLKVLLIRTTVTWHGSLSVYFNLGGIQMGLTRLTLEGDLIVELVGQMDRPPLFQGARACFINPPKLNVEYDVGSKTANALAQFGPMKRTIVQVLTEQVSNKLVLPNSKGVKLDKHAEVFRILHPPPRGILRVTVVRAEKLLGKDHNLFSAATSDPFIKVSCGALSFKSEVKSRTCSPQFDWEFVIAVDHPLEQLVKFELMDADTLTAHDFLGLCTLRARTLISQGSNEVSYELEDEKGKTGGNGSIVLKTEWRELLLKPPKRYTVEAVRNFAHIFVGVYGAKHLPPAPRGTKYWATVQCSGRVGMGGLDPKKPRETKKVVLKELTESKEEQEAKQFEFREKKKLCETYRMRPQDIAKLLDVEVDELSRPDARGDRRLHDAEFDAAMQFFAEAAQEAVLDITLKCMHPADHQEHLHSAADDGDVAAGERPSGVSDGVSSTFSPQGQRSPRSGGAMSKLRANWQRGFLPKAAATVGAKLLLHTAHKCLREEAVVIHQWQLKVSNFLEGGNGPATKVLTVPHTGATLHVRIQARGLGRPSVEPTGSQLGVAPQVFSWKQ